MTDSFDEMRRKMAGLDPSSLSALGNLHDLLAAAARMAYPSEVVMEEAARQQKLMEQLVHPFQATEALLGVSRAADIFLKHEMVLNSSLKAVYASGAELNYPFAQAEYHKSITDAMMGPYAELRATGVLANLATQESLRATSLLTDYESSFRLATRTDFDALATLTRNDHSLAVLYHDDIALATRAVGLPLVRIDDPTASLQAFTELQSITRAVALLAPYDDRLTSTLRDDFGDWRNLVAPPASVFGDIAARTALYLERGLRPGLTDFPAAVFETSIEFGEAEGVSLADLYGEPIEPPDDEDISAFVRTNEVQGWIHRFERQIRAFIDKRMTKAYGTDWPRLKLPPLIYQDWKDKSVKAAAVGKPNAPLILFADFTHYEGIICNKGHWALFQDAFKTKDALYVRESFNRLQLPRIESHHGRMLTQDDYLFAYAELKRLGKAIKS